MIFGMALLPLLALSGLGFSQPAAAPQADAESEPPPVRRVIVRGQLIVRVPVRARQSQVTPQSFTLRDGPQCLPSRAISGALISGKRSVDFVLQDRRRLRVEMENDCSGLDFYGGFYLQPSDDQLCADRDIIRTRMGGSCRIEKFHLLEPRKR